MALSGPLVQQLRNVLGKQYATEFVAAFNALGGDGTAVFTTSVTSPLFLSSGTLAATGGGALAIIGVSGGSGAVSIGGGDTTYDLVAGDTSLTETVVCATGEYETRLTDNLADAWSLKIAGGNDIFVVTTTNSAEGIAFASTCTVTVSGTFTAANPLQTSAGVGTVAGTGITVQERGDGSIHKSVFTLTAHSMTITDAGAAGAHGSTTFYTFPEGHIKIIGGHMALTNITAGAGGIGDTATMDIGVGTAAVATDNGELTSTEADIILIDEKQLASGTATGDGKMGLTNVQIDGSASAGSLKLNVAMPDADSASSDTLSVTGTITIYWIHEGDD